jgi:hypothetical protein
MKRTALVFTVFLTGCGPSLAPVGHRSVCDWIRQAVEQQSMNVVYANQFYPDCRPIQGPS